MSFDQLADQKLLEKTQVSLKEKNYDVFFCDNKETALEKIKSLIPSGATVMNGASVTLEQIGFIEYLKSGKHTWNNLHAEIVNEKDPDRQKLLRKQAVLSDYYLGSVHALVSNGEFIIASNTGSQLPHIVYTSQNLIFVVSTKKIVENLSDAFSRLEEHVVPLEDQQSQRKYGRGTELNKIVVFKGENERSGRKITFLLLPEDLGF